MIISGTRTKPRKVAEHPAMDLTEKDMSTSFQKVMPKMLVITVFSLIARLFFLLKILSIEMSFLLAKLQKR